MAPVNPSSNADFVTLKYSSSGQPVWTNVYGGPAGLQDDPVAIAVNGLGEVFVTGQSYVANIYESTTVACIPDLLTYAPRTNFVGLDSISYTLADAFGDSAAGTVPVLVTSTNFALVPLSTALSGNGRARHKCRYD